MVGKVKWFNNEKGYGFINYDGGNDIFVHYKNIVEKGYKTLEEGQEVNFNLINTERGLKAISVEKN